MEERDADIFNLYSKVVNDRFVQQILAELSLGLRDRVFNYVVVMWLMIFQRLDSDQTLAQVLDELKKGKFDALLGRKGETLSSSTSGYAHARERLPLVLVERTADNINNALARMHKEERWKGLKVYLIDGSSLTLPGTKELKKKYPPCQNQCGESAWAKIRTLHVHDLVTGIALRPEYGPMYGDSAVGELTMLPALLERVEKEAVFVADRLYGCFQVAYSLAQQGYQALVRMTDDRAGKFLRLLNRPGEVTVKWQPSSHERRRHSHLPDDACVEGRFIWFRLETKGYKPQDFYFFTTLALPAKDIMDLYILRWNIETDLRSIKSTMRLSEIRAKSPDMIAKEIILGHVAYNLVRNVMALTAQLAKIDPRHLSFARFVSLIAASAPNIWMADRRIVIKCLAGWLRDVRYYMLPKTKREAEPRKILLRRCKFSHLHLPRAVEKELLQISRLAA